VTGITNPTEEYFKDGAWGWDGTQWRKLALLWGYTERYAENLGGTKSGDGTYEQSGTVVPSGEVWVVECISLYNHSGARGAIALQVNDGTTNYAVTRNLTPVQYELVSFIGRLTLEAGDKVLVQQSACLDGDVLRGVAWGYKMAVT